MYVYVCMYMYVCMDWEQDTHRLASLCIEIIRLIMVIIV